MSVCERLRVFVEAWGAGGKSGGGGGSFRKDRFHRPPEFVRFVPVLFYLHRDRKDIHLFFH